MNLDEQPRVELLVALVIGCSTLMMAAGFIVRTRSVIGPTVERQLDRWAEARQANLTVGSMRPTGVFGVRLDRVELSLNRSGARVELAVEAIEVRPSIPALLRGEVRAGHMVLRGGEARLVTPVDSPDDPTPSPTDSAPAPPPESADPGAENQPSEPPPFVPTDIKVELEDFRIAGTLRPTGPYPRVASRPVTLGRAELKVREERHGFRLEQAEGFGTFPDGVAFAFSSSTAAESRQPEEPVEITVAPQEPTRLDGWFDPRPPVEVEAGSFKICPQCHPRRVCAADLSWRRPPFGFKTAGGCALAGPEGLHGDLKEVEIRHDGEWLPFRLTELSADWPRAEGPLAGRATLSGEEIGRAALEARWHRADRHLAVTFESDRFHLERFWKIGGLDHLTRRGIIDGEIRLDVYRASGLAHLTGQLGYRDGVILHDFLNQRPLHIESSRLHLDILSDLAGENISLNDTRIALGTIAPVHLNGSVTRAEPGWAFEGEARAEGVSAPGLRESLPSTLAMPAVGAEMRGSFDLSIYAAGHTAFPDSLKLDIEVDGDVDVLRESPNTDVPSLALNGPPLIGPPSNPFSGMPLSDWVDLSALPPVLPRVLLAAEDAKFYQHPGFDWRGIRNAMVHNLKEGRLERGGSTITQQLAKNLFLTRKRTLARKLKEVWVTWRLESILSKDRLLELYLNIAEWGPGVTGLREAAHYYFDRPPEELTIPQMTLLGTLLPGPNLYGPLIRKGYLPSSRLEKVEHILDNLRYLEIIAPEKYTELYGAAEEGKIGGLELTVCRDNEYVSGDVPKCDY